MKTDPRLGWLDATGFFSIHLGLERPKRLMERLGNPQDSLRFIHVAGSNGKGSVCVDLESALRKCGFHTAFYPSPHLVKLNERFRIDGHDIDDDTLFRAAEKVRVQAEAMRSEDGMNPTYFELTTAIALVLFAEARAEWVVWETGLGGRLDATSIVMPELSIITGISLEHTEWLGRTPAEIASEKAGIIKPGVPVVCRRSIDSAAYAVIAGRADRLGCRFTAVPDYDGPFEIIRKNGLPAGQRIVLDGRPVTLGLFGAHQRLNAKIAWEAAKILGLDPARTAEGFAEAEWPARFQIIPEKRLILDGAHNPEAAAVLGAALEEIFPGEKMHFISGCFIDKNAHDILNAFLPHAKDFRFLAFDGSGRGVRSPSELGAMLGGAVPWRESTLKESLGELPADNGAWSVLTGSLHLCGEALELLA